MRGGRTGRGRRALEVFTGTVCVTVTSQAPLWFRIRPQELGDKDTNGRCGGRRVGLGRFGLAGGLGALVRGWAGSLGGFDLDPN